MSTSPCVVWFADLDTKSEHFGSHSKHHAMLTQAKFPLVPGFVITPFAYRNFLRENALELKIKQILSTVSLERADSLMQGEFHIKNFFMQAKLSENFIDELLTFYQRLGPEVNLEIFETGNHGKKHKKNLVSQSDALVKEVITMWAEMFASHALWRRHQQHLDHFKATAEIIVRKKIHGDKTGKVFTIDPATHAKDKIFIQTVTPHINDRYLLSKKNLTIIDRTIKHAMLTEKLSLDEILAIAKMAKRLDEHLYLPQEISWIIANNKLYIFEVKPITEFVKEKTEKIRKIPLARGKGITSYIGTGIANVINTQTNLQKIHEHDVLIISEMHPKQIEKLKKIRGIIIENHPHAATAVLLKKHGIPAICNVKHATKRFSNGHVITIDGEKGEIYH